MTKSFSFLTILLITFSFALGFSSDTLFPIPYPKPEKVDYEKNKKEFLDSLSPILLNDEPGFIDKKNKVIYSTKTKLRLEKESQLTQENGIWESIVGRDGKVEIVNRDSFFDTKDLAYVNTEISLYPVKMEDKWGYINYFGKIIIPAQFSKAKWFEGKYAAVQTGTKWGLINSLGMMVIEPMYEDISPFYEELAAVKLNDLWGYLDESGKMIIEPKFQEALPFVKGKAKVKKNDKWYLLHNKGKYLEKL